MLRGAGHRNHFDYIKRVNLNFADNVLAAQQLAIISFLFGNKIADDQDSKIQA